MTTESTRQADVRPLLPIALLVVLLGVSGLIALVAPSRVTGVYQVIIGEGSSQFTVTDESLDCGRVGAKASCTLSVAGRPLEITVVYPNDNPIVPGTCTAVHDGRPVFCTSQIGDYGHASQSVRIADGLGVTDAERDRWRDAVPWWREADELLAAAYALVGVLAAAAGAAAYLLCGRFRLAAPGRVPVAIGTGLLGALTFGVGSSIIAPSGFGQWIVLLAPPGLLATAVLVGWQWGLGELGGGTRRSRWGFALGSAAATAVYSGVAVLVFLLASGFID